MNEESRPEGAAPERILAKASGSSVQALGHPSVRLAVRSALETAAARRARVLRHDDLAQRLLAPPLRYSRPEVWSGYIPPATGPYGAKWPDDRGRGYGVDDAPNTSPCRVALIELLNAVVERERTAA